MYSSAPIIPVTVTLTINSTHSFTKTLPLLKPHFPSYKFNSLVSHCSNSDREDQRWLREEQRWLREEQRWLREENRWNRQRDELLTQISELKLQIESLERRIVSSSSSASSVSDAVANVASLLQVLKDKNLVLESGSSQRRIVFEEEEGEETVDVVEHEKEEKESLEHVKEILVVEEAAARVEQKIVLRNGSEGEEVREMQVRFLFFFFVNYK